MKITILNRTTIEINSVEIGKLIKAELNKIKDERGFDVPENPTIKFRTQGYSTIATITWDESVEK